MILATPIRKVEKILSKTQKYIVWLFLLSLLLIKIPPFYFSHQIKSTFLTTHTLARLLISLAFLSLVLSQVLNKRALFRRKEKLLLGLFLVYFIFHSVSVLSAINLISFLQRYKDVFFPGLFLFTTLGLDMKRKPKGIITIFLIAAVFNFFYQAIMFLAPGLFQSLGSLLIYKKHFELVSINLSRARLFIETYDEIAIPFLFLLFGRYKKRWQRVLIFTIFLLTVMPSLLSNFRSRVLMLVFALFTSFLFLSGKELVSKLGFLVSFLVLSWFSVVVLNSIFGFSFLDRFALQDKREDVQTIESRVENIETSANIGLAYPLFGVGLGNYYEYLPTSKKTRAFLFNWINRESEIASTNPHNIFAQILTETGLASMLFYAGMLGYFAYGDFRTLFKRKEGQTGKAFIISFWTLFLYSLFNPTTTLTYNTFFWVIRGII